MSKIRLTDESVNKYGFRVLTTGLDLTEFRKNPVMFFGHDEWGLPIGRWENIEVKNGEIFATPLFDEDDQFAMKVKAKWEKGILNAASIGISVIEVSEDPKLMLKGQTRPTVTKSRMREASIVNVPANSNAYKLYFEDNQSIQLSDAMSEGKLNEVLPKIQKQQSMKKIALQLGLSEDATEEQILAALASRGSAEQAAPVTTTPAPASTPVIVDDAVEAVVALGESKGLKADNIRALAKADLKAALSFVKEFDAPAQQAQAQPPKPTVTAAEIVKLAQQGGSQQKPEGKETWTFSDWQKKDPKGLQKLKAEKPEEYQALADAHVKAFKEKTPQWFQG